MTRKPETIAGYPVHPAAALFPMMGDTELAELAGDILANGQIHPVVLSEGVVLDGRNRLAACQLAGVPPRTVEWEGAAAGASPTAFVVSVNLQRRHLSTGQLAILAADLLPMFQAEAKARQGRMGRNNLPTNGKAHELAQNCANSEEERRGKATQQAAAAVGGVSSRTVESAKALKEKAPPELVDAVRSGQMSLKQAERTVKRAEQVAAVKAYEPPTGKYGVIVADPPWQYTKRAQDVTSRGHTDYPTEPGDKIVELVSGMLNDLADETCILWLWITNAHLLEGLGHDILAATGFTGKTVLTWAKDRLGVGDWLRGQTEHVILAVRGSPPVTLTNQSTLLVAPRREPGRKPAGFYELVESLCPSPSKLELFSRERRPGWVTSGAEVEQFSATKEG